MGRILTKITIDESVLDDTIQASLCQANIVQVGKHLPPAVSAMSRC